MTAVPGRAVPGGRRPAVRAGGQRSARRTGPPGSAGRPDPTAACPGCASRPHGAAWPDPRAGPPRGGRPGLLGGLIRLRVPAPERGLAGYVGSAGLVSTRCLTPALLRAGLALSALAPGGRQGCGGILARLGDAGRPARTQRGGPAGRTGLTSLLGVRVVGRTPGALVPGRRQRRCVGLARLDTAPNGPAWAV